MPDNAVARSQHFLLLAQGMRLLLFLLATGFLGTALTPGDFGFFALVSTLFAVSYEVIDMGSSAVATRKIAQIPAAEREILNALLSWRRLLALLLALACVVLADTNFVTTGEQRATLIATAGAIFLLHLNAYYIALQVRQTLGRPLLLGLAAQIAFLLGSLLSVRLEAAGSVIALLVVGREIAQVIGGSLIAVRALGYRLRARLSSPELRPLLREAWLFGLCALFYKLAFHAGSFFVWATASPEALATFSASLRILLPAIDTVWVFIAPLIPTLSLAATIDRAAFVGQLNGYLNLILGAAALFAVCGITLAPAILDLLYGGRYTSGPLSSLNTFRWLSVAFAFAMITPVLVVATLAQRRERELFAFSISGLALNLLINAWTAPRYGSDGAAMASCVSEAFIVAGLAWRLTRTGELRPDAGTLQYFAPAIFIGGILFVLADQPRIALVVALLAVPLALITLWRRPEQKACRSRLADVRATPSPASPSSVVTTRTNHPT